MAPPAMAEAGGLRAGPVVATSEGRIRGSYSDRAVKFLGVPYAEPPVGPLRWQPPRNHKPWTGVRDATRFGSICALTTTLGVFSGPRNDNEDCLHLNVFTPSLKSSAHLPVIVYIHGGGNYDGETKGLDGGHLASNGNIVVVTVEYRLNLFGFLAHPALDSEGHPFANYGILDQQAALKWVRRNIDKFGGNRNNVTVAGQSSGAVDTMINIVSPGAVGLFHRAICQSACLATYPLAKKEAAEVIGVSFAEAAGCGSGTGPAVAQCLRSLPASKIEELAGTAIAPSKYVIGTGIVDGEIIPDQPLTLFRGNRFNHVPMMNGFTTDEVNFTLAIREYWSNADNALRSPVGVADYQDYVSSYFTPPSYAVGTAPKVLALYPVDGSTSPQLAWNRATSDARACDVRSLARILAPKIPVYVYEFADKAAPSYFPDMPSMVMGAYHTADIQYLFPSWHGGPEGIRRPLSSQQTLLSAQIIASWSNFARTGNPNVPGKHVWASYSNEPDAPAWMVQDLPGQMAVTDDIFSLRHRCPFWDAALTN